MNNSTISHGNATTKSPLSPANEPSGLHSIDAQTASAQSNKALQFKRRRDHSKQGKSGQKYSQYGTIQQSDPAARNAGPAANHSKNNLSAYYSHKPPLSTGNERGATGGQARQSSHEGKSRLNNTQPISSQKRISKHRAANAAVSSTEKIRQGRGS